MTRGLILLMLCPLLAGCPATLIVSAIGSASSVGVSYLTYKATDRNVYTLDCVGKKIFITDGSSLSDEEINALLAHNALMDECPQPDE